MREKGMPWQRQTKKHLLTKHLPAIVRPFIKSIFVKHLPPKWWKKETISLQIHIIFRLCNYHNRYVPPFSSLSLSLQICTDLLLLSLSLDLLHSVINKWKWIYAHANAHQTRRLCAVGWGRRQSVVSPQRPADQKLCRDRARWAISQRGQKRDQFHATVKFKPLLLPSFLPFCLPLLVGPTISPSRIFPSSSVSSLGKSQNTERQRPARRYYTNGVIVHLTRFLTKFHTCGRFKYSHVEGRSHAEYIKLSSNFSTK